MPGTRPTGTAPAQAAAESLTEARRRTGAAAPSPAAGPAALLALQRDAGNGAVSALLAARLRGPEDTAREHLDDALSELKGDDPALPTVEKGLKAAKDLGVPVEIEGPKPPASALAVVRTGFGPGSVAPPRPPAPAKPVPAKPALGKAAAKPAGGHGGGAGATTARAGGAPPAAAGGAVAAAPAPLAAEQLLQPPVAPTGVWPDDDPAFAAVAHGVAGVGAQKRAHPTAASKAAEAQGAALAPPDDVAAQAKAAKADSMDAQQPGAFDKKAFIAAVKTAIEAKSPKNLEEASDDPGKAGDVKGDVQGLVGQGKAGQTKDIAAATAAPPDASKAVEKPVTPMGPEDAGPTGAVPAAGAAPKPAPAEQLNLNAGKAQADQELTDAQVTETQLAKSNEPEFEQAVTDKHAAAEHADTAPGQYRQQEVAAIDQSKAAAGVQTTTGLAGMQASKGATLAALVAQKGATKSKDEAKRAEVTTKIQGIFDATEARVREILEGIDPLVDDEFTRGEAAAKSAFESYVAAKMSAYKEDRYSGWLGGLRWAKDKLVGMPDAVNEFYTAGRELYLQRMDGVISRVADIVGNGLTAAKLRIASGKAEIATYVKSLPADLQKVGTEASTEMGDRFADLEKDVDSKQNALVDSLASKYVESRKALDDRIGELQAENKGLVDKAIGAIKAVIDTIRKLVSMLTTALARVSSVIGDIVADPIGFLGNLVAGVKGGIDKFFGNIEKHLREGLMNWLFGELAAGGIELPETFDIKGILKLVASIFGLTWTNIRSRIVKQIGEKAMAAVEKGVEIFQVIATQGIGGLWEMLVAKLGDIKEMILEKVKDFVITKIITAGITWLISLLNPAAAFIKACKMIYDVVMFFVNNAERIMEFVNTVIDSVAEVVKGNVSGVVDKIEDVLGKMVPILIGFLASALGVGGIGEKIREIVGALRKPVNTAVDFVVKQGLRLAGPVIRAAQGVAGKVKSKVAAGKAWVKGKVDAGKTWVKDKAVAVGEKLGIIRSPFQVRLPGGGVESHTVTTKPKPGGGFETIVASTPTEIATLLRLYEGRLGEIQETAAGRSPRAEARTAIWNCRNAVQELEADQTAKSEKTSTDKQARSLQKLLELFARFGRGRPQVRAPEAKNWGQQLTARITVVVPPDERAMVMGGAHPRGTGDSAPAGTGYALFNATSGLGSRGLVRTSGDAVNTGTTVVEREVVSRAWASGGATFQNSTDGHTEMRLLEFLEAQGDDFLARVVALEIRSTLSACSGCSAALSGLRQRLDRNRYAFTPGAPIGTAALTFTYSTPYQPEPGQSAASRQAGQTTTHDLSALRDARWLVHGPPLHEV